MAENVIRNKASTSVDSDVPLEDKAGGRAGRQGDGMKIMNAGSTDSPTSVVKGQLGKGSKEPFASKSGSVNPSAGNTTSPGTARP